MRPFTFQTTRSVLCEVGATGKIGGIMAGRGCRKVAFVTDAMILELGLARVALDGLEAAGVDVWIFSEVVADPPEAMILGAVEAARAEGIDGVVSVGGGSSLDTAKLIAILLGTDQPIEAIYGVGLVEGERLPLVLAPTTAGTGSEVTPISIVTTGANEKKGVVSPQLLPDWAILDAELTVGLPAHVTAATGVDAMVHAIEAYTSRHRKNPVSDCLAREALTKAALTARKARGTRLGNPTNAPEAAALGREVLVSEADRFAANVLPVILSGTCLGANPRIDRFIRRELTNPELKHVARSPSR